jgi:putative hydrolase of HD superfamily
LWQWIAGGGEDGESPLDAAKRETFEETGIESSRAFTRLDSTSTIPVVGVGGFLWGDDTFVISEHAFGVEVLEDDIRLSHEHDEYAWLCYEDAYERLKWDSNRNALWELDHRLRHRKALPVSGDTSDDSDRLAAQIRFVLEVDKLKQILRRSYVTDGSRRENDAEHSWHLGLMALLLREHSPDTNLDILRVLGMVLVHDLVEIYAGDTLVYDIAGEQLKYEREVRAADELFAMLPKDQTSEIRALWDEFEARVTAEAKYARALDRLQPILLNYSTGGRTWQENNVTFEMTMNLNPPIIRDGAPALAEFVVELLEDARRQGFFS